MNLLLFSPEEVDNQRVVLSDDRARHLKDVLKVRPGRILEAGILNHSRGHAEVLIVGSEIVLRYAANNDPTPKPQLDMILAIPRPKALRRLLTTIASMGVAQLWLTNAWRVEKSYLKSRLLNSKEMMNRQLLLGCTQAKTTYLPDIKVFRTLTELFRTLESLPQKRKRIIFEPNQALTIADLGRDDALKRKLIAVGPEGGWIEREIERFKILGFNCCSLGDAILRTENAVVSAIAQLDLIKRLNIYEVKREIDVG